MGLDLALNSGRDLDLSALGEARLLDGADRVRQQIGITLRAFLGEWFLDTSFGVPYFEQILVKGGDRAVIESVLRARIAAVPDVTGIEALDLKIDRESRLLDVELTAVTALGRVAVQVAIATR